MKNLTIIKHNDVNVVDSRDVAEMTGKQHSHLMRDIKGYTEILKNSTNPKLDALDFFVESTYLDSKGEERPCYLLTRKGCDMVANKMTGEKGVLFTAAYVTKFEEMEKQVQAPQFKLSKELQAIFLLDEKQQVIENRIDDLESNMPLFNVECKELQALVRKVGIKVLGGYKSPAYQDNSLRGKIYSDIQHQLRREFGIERYEAIKRSQLKTARKIVSEYKAPTVLINEISLANRQVKFEREVG